MELSAWTPQYRHIVETCEPFIISYTENWPHLDLAPFGVSISEAHRFTATRLASRDVINGLHHLDAVTFGDQNMLMPRWVLFDCGEFPGIVFGFGRKAKDLPSYARTVYEVAHRDEAFVPLSMWVAIPCAEPRAWFGHNLSSANLILQGNDALPGLALLTKALGVKITRCKKQYGATQWSSPSIGLHLKLGDMEVLSAYTPAHTHPETLAYCIDVDDATLAGNFQGAKPRAPQSERLLAAHDTAAIRALHDEIEAGSRWQITGVERPPDGQRLHLRSL
jgi:hypothetical protein